MIDLKNKKIILVLFLSIKFSAFGNDIFKESGFEIEIPEGISFSIRTPEVNKNITLNSDISMILQIKRLKDYIYGQYSGAYLSDEILNLKNEGKNIDINSITSILKKQGSNFVLVYPFQGYEVLNSYKKVTSQNNVIGESYFGFIGDGGLAPRGYYFRLLLIKDNIVITIRIRYYDKDLYKKLSKDYFYINVHSTVLIKKPVRSKLESFYLELKNEENFIKLNEVFSHLLESVVIDGQKILLINNL